MIVNTISYWIAEALSSIVKNQKIFWSSVAIMTITLFLISFLCILFHGSNILLANYEESQGKIEVFPDYKTAEIEVKVDVTDALAIQNIRNEIAELSSVKSIKYETREKEHINVNDLGEETIDTIEIPYYIVTIEDYRLANQTIEKIQEISGVAKGSDDIVLKKLEYDLESKLLALNGVKNIEFISKEEAKKRAEDSVPPAMIEGVPDITFPESYILTIEDLSMTQQIAQEIRGIEGVGQEVGDVQVNEYINLISKTAISVKVLAVTIFIITTVGSCYVMMNSIKLMLYARRKEISIMKYVGATDKFTKAPFVIEGLIIGLVSAGIVILATSCICGGIATLSNEVAILVFLANIEEIVPTVALVLVLLGVGTGSIGSSMSINKYLEV